MVGAVVLLPDGTHKALKHVPSLKELQTFVGGFIELVPAPHAQCIAYANEEGMLLQLPINTWREKLIELGFYIPFTLHGAVVVLGENKDGEDCALDEEIAKKLLE